MLTNSYIKESARAVGFDLVGVTFAKDFPKNKAAIQTWIEAGGADNLDYMQRYMDIRFNPANLLEGGQTVVVCAINCKNQYSLKACSDRPKIASYALAPDYHKIIRRQLKALLKRLQATEPALQGRCCVDTAPLLEKQLAHEAGLGWIGRQSLLITPQFGSFVLLGVLLLNCEVDSFDSPLSGKGCGECRRCIENCPASAILENRMIDSRLCISALTVECDNPKGNDLNGWLFGCDECQICCPHNSRTPLATNSAIQPIFDPILKEQWLSMSDDLFADQLNATPMKRAGLERIQRNCSCVSDSLNITEK